MLGLTPRGHHWPLLILLAIAGIASFQCASTARLAEENEMEHGEPRGRNMQRSVSAGTTFQFADTLNLIGYVPSRYFHGGYLKKSAPGGLTLAKVEILGGVIKAVEPISVSAAERSRDSLLLKSGRDYDVIYPGMINLHTHAANNMLSLWTHANGQFNNRSEWRSWPAYRNASSLAVNPWQKYGDDLMTASFRWSHLAALVSGTTYQQCTDYGCTKLVAGFAANTVEDEANFRFTGEHSDSDVSGTMELFAPKKSVILKKYIYPRMQRISREKELAAVTANVGFEAALHSLLQEWCPGAEGLANEPSVKAFIDFFADVKNVKKFCPHAPNDVFLSDFMGGVYGRVLEKKAFLLKNKSGGGNAYIIHLAEGARLDPFNRLEFTLLRILGMDLPGMNLIHAMGLQPDEFSHMAKQGMGLIWSPFSNLILYGETTEVGAALSAGVTVALGTDWTPTGTRNLLEELAIARQYVARQKRSEPSLAAINDEVLYKMVTENPARLIGRLHTPETESFHGVGAVVPGAMASLVVFKKARGNAYGNLILSDVANVRLVLVDGQARYGARDLVMGLAKLQGVSAPVLESMPESLRGFTEMEKDKFPVLSVPDDTLPDSVKTSHVQKTLERAARHLTALQSSNSCGYSDRVFVPSTTASTREFKALSQMDLDRYSDLQRVLGTFLVTQNAFSEKGEPGGYRELPPLFTCNDPDYRRRLRSFFVKGGEFDSIKDKAKRDGLREHQSFLAASEELSKLYELGR